MEPGGRASLRRIERASFWIRRRPPAAVGGRAIAVGCRDREKGRGRRCPRATRWRQGSRSVRTCVDSMGFSEAKERGPGREEMACRLLGPWGWRQLLEAEAGAVGRYTGVGGKDRIRRPGEAGRRRRVGWWRRPSVCFVFPSFFSFCSVGSPRPVVYDAATVRPCECDAPWRLFQRALFPAPD